MSRELSLVNIQKELGIDWSFELIDTHMHLDYLKFKSQEEIVKLSHDLGIPQMITIAVSEGHLDELIEIANRFEGLFCTQGIHPHHAKEMNDAILKKIEANSHHKKVVAIGEVGLDYHYDHSPRDVQRDVFEKMVELSILRSLPLIIHTREAEEDTIAILKKHLPKLKNGVLLHSYSSNRELADFGIKEGFFFGFNGMITFKKNENIKEIIDLVPAEKILLETDAPFLAPVPFRGVENGPYLLPFIGLAIAKIKNLDPKEFFKLTTENAKNLFHI